MKFSSKALSILVYMLFVSQVQASVTVIFFDEDAKGSPIVNGQIVEKEYAAFGVRLKNKIVVSVNDQLSKHNVVFDTNHDNVQVQDLEYEGDSNTYYVTKKNSNFKYTAVEIDHVEHFSFKFNFPVDFIFSDTFDFTESDLLTAMFFDENNDKISTDFVFSAKLKGGGISQNIGVNEENRLKLGSSASVAINNFTSKTAGASEPVTIGILSLALLLMFRRAKK